MKLEEVLLQGNRAGQPAANSVPAGTLYFVTDEGKLEQSDAASWSAYGVVYGTGVAAFLATPSSANLATAVTGETGSGALVFGTSPALTTPNLGTPSAGVLTNCTGLPTAGLVDAAVTFAKIQNADALSVPVRASNSSGVLDELALSDGQTVKRVGTSLVSARFGPASISVLTNGSGATYTVPAGVYRLKVTCVGAGGGGGGADGGSSQAGVGSGGGSGAIAIKVYSTTPSSTFTYTVSNAGGTGGSAGNNNGNDGTDTVFDSGGTPVTAEGGNGGGSMAAGTGVSASGSNGSAQAAATGGDVNIPGTNVQRAFRISGTEVVCAVGAPSPYGAGGLASNGNADGGAASGYGAGGGGAGSLTVTDRAGGNGAPGVIIVEEYN